MLGYQSLVRTQQHVLKRVGALSSMETIVGTSRMLLSTSTVNMESLVKLDIDGHVATITLNDPTRLNALTEAMGDELIEVVQRINQTEHVRAAILTGAGKAFSAGGDLKFLQDRMEEQVQRKNVLKMLNFYDRFLTIRKLNVPVIAAINGSAIGAGMCLAGACDIRVGNLNAQMGYTFAKLGIHPGMAASHLAVMALGQQRATELLLTGETMSGSQALQHGFILDGANSIDEVLSKANQIAKRITAASPQSVQSTIKSLRNRQDIGLRDSLLREATAQSDNFAANDIREGIQAILEKRSPKH
eukprot:m.64301 g.64301  ORF g.64301 m.64301 type:complete len:302 (+) comp8109_c0_seq4:123-1028(+)